MKTKVNFLLAGSANALGEKVIMVNWYYGYKDDNDKYQPLYFSTGFTTIPLNWDSVTKRTTNNKVVNRSMDELELDILRVVRQFKLDEHYPTPDDIKSKLKTFSDVSIPTKTTKVKLELTSITEFIKDEILNADRNKTGLSKGSISQYNSCYQRFLLYELEFGKLFFETLTKNQLTLFNDWVKECKLKSGKTISKNTIYNMQVFIKKIINLAKEKDIKCNVISTDVKSVTKTDNKTIYLNFDKLKQLENHKQFGVHLVPFHQNKNLNIDLDVVRDLLIVSAYTALRISDWCENPTIKVEKGVKYLQVVTTKTGTELEIPLMKPVLKIYEKYGNKFPAPIYKDTYNIALKYLGKLIGWTEDADIDDASYNPSVVTKGKKKGKDIKVPFYTQMSSHIGRRSFATNLYKMGFTADEIMIYTGHTTIESFMKYIQITDGEKKESFVLKLKKFGL